MARAINQTYRTIDTSARTEPPSRSGLLRVVVATLVGLAGMASTRRQREQLRDLDPRLLRDIGYEPPHTPGEPPVSLRDGRGGW